MKGANVKETISESEKKLLVKHYNKLLKKMTVKSKFKSDKLSQGLYKLTLYCVDKSKIPSLSKKIAEMIEGEKPGKSTVKFVESKKSGLLLRDIPSMDGIYGMKKNNKTLKKKKKSKKHRKKKKKTMR